MSTLRKKGAADSTVSSDVDQVPCSELPGLSVFIWEVATPFYNNPFASVTSALFHPNPHKADGCRFLEKWHRANRVSVLILTGTVEQDVHVLFSRCFQTRKSQT